MLVLGKFLQTLSVFMLKCAFYFIPMFLLVSGNPCSHANSECYIFNSTPAFFFIYHLHWLHWVIEHPYVSFTTPSPSTCVSKGSGRISDGCGMLQRKRWVETQPSGSWASMVVPFGGFWLSFLPSHCTLVVQVGVYTILVRASPGRKRRQRCLRKIVKSLQRMYTCPFRPITVLLSQVPISLHKPPDQMVCHSCHYPGSTSLDGLSTSLIILHLFLAICFIYPQWQSVKYFTLKFLILLNSGVLHL